MARTELLQILACPLCEQRPKLELFENALKCPNCASSFKLKELSQGLKAPDLLPENAIKGKA